MAKGKNKKAKEPVVRKLRIQASKHGSVSKPNPTRENINEKDRQTPYVPFFKGSRNIYINDLALRARRSGTHGAVLRSKWVFSKGKGLIYFKDGKPHELTTEQEAYADEVNNKNESLWDVITKVLKDYISFGNAYPEVSKVDNRKNLFHRDATTVRVSKDGKKGFMSAHWRDIKDDEHPTAEFKITPINIDSGNKFLTHIKNYEPEFETYGVIDHTGALKDADIEYKVSTFNLDKLDNGFFPSVLMQLFGEPPEGKTGEEYIQDIINQFTGEGNARKVVAELLDSPEQAAKIHEFTQPQSGEFESLKKLAKETILEAHRWHPALMMLTPGKLANSSDIRTAYEMVKNTVIPDYRAPVLKRFERLLQDTPLKGLKLGFAPLLPVSLADKINPEKVWTIDEQRAEIGSNPLVLDEDEPGGVLLKETNNARIEIPE